MDSRMKLPGKDHPIEISTHEGRVVVRFAGEIVADTKNALSLQEASYPRVLYVPRADARLDRFERSTHHSYCPYKGEAGYFHLRTGPSRAENAVWTYETPYPAMAAIAGHLAFYPDKVTIEAE